jgi:hypothetical protein
LPTPPFSPPTIKITVTSEKYLSSLQAFQLSIFLKS